MQCSQRESRDVANLTDGSETITVNTYYKLKDKRIGICKYIGSTNFQPGEWFGFELVEGTGETNGSVNGVSYFKSETGKGLFVQIQQIAERISSPRTNINVSNGTIYSREGSNKFLPKALEYEDEVKETISQGVTRNLDGQVWVPSLKESGETQRDTINDENVVLFDRVSLNASNIMRESSVKIKDLMELDDKIPLSQLKSKLRNRSPGKEVNVLEFFPSSNEIEEERKETTRIENRLKWINEKDIWKNTTDEDLNNLIEDLRRWHPNTWNAKYEERTTFMHKRFQALGLKEGFYAGFMDRDISSLATRRWTIIQGSKKWHRKSDQFWASELENVDLEFVFTLEEIMLDDGKEEEIRDKWKVGSKVQVYNEKTADYVEGTIVALDTQGDVKQFHVEYSVNGELSKISAQQNDKKMVKPLSVTAEKFSDFVKIAKTFILSGTVPLPCFGTFFRTEAVENGHPVFHCNSESGIKAVMSFQDYAKDDGELAWDNTVNVLVEKPILWKMMEVEDAMCFREIVKFFVIHAPFRGRPFVRKWMTVLLPALAT